MTGLLRPAGEMYHNQQPTDGRSPSILENQLTSSYSLATLIDAASDFKNINHHYKKENCMDTTASAYPLHHFSSEQISYLSDDLDDLIDEAGEAEADRESVGIESEEYTLNLEGLDIARGYDDADEDTLYAPLELSPNEMYMNSLLDTEIDVARPYDSKSRMDVTGIPFYEVSYYNAGSTDEMMEPESAETEIDAIFTVSTASMDDSEPDEEPNYNKRGNLEARLGL